MKHSLMQRARWAALFAVILALPRCNSGGDSSDGKSSWLEECRKDSDCTGETTCHCGVCTKGCGTASDCGGLASSTCVETSERSATDCRVGVFSRSGVCLPSCTGDGECPGRSGAMRCESGVCIPVAVAVGSDAGALPPPSGGGSGGATGTGGSNAGASSGGAGTGGARSSGGGTGAPIGEANAYGAPVTNAEDFAGACPGLPVISGDAENCIHHAQCEHVCERDAECPGVAGSSAVPVCGFGLFCELLCEEGRMCPAGMACMQFKSGRFCRWQSWTPGCEIGADLCKQRPRPPSCPDDCAALAVACDDALGVTCCEGLRCGPENFCVAEGS